MRTLLHLLATGVLAMSANVAGAAASFTCEGIIYNITGDTTCEVGRQTPAEISGTVILPSNVSAEDGKTYVLTSVSNFAFVTCSALTEVTIPETVVTVGNSSFSKCSSLKVVRFSGAPTSVGSNCFSESNSIVEVYTPGLDSWISTDFKDASANPLNYGAELLDTTGHPVDCSVIPEGTKRIGNYSLSGMKTLVSVTLPEGLEEIGIGAFSGSPVRNVNIPSLADWARITFGNYTANPLYSGKALLVQNGQEIRNLDIPAGVATINNYAFMNYLAAESITIPASVTSVGTQAFSGCTSVRTLSLGECVETIGMNAFQKIDFTSVQSYSANPPQLARNAFSETTYSKAELTVPKGSLESYKSAYLWKKFLNISESGTTQVETITDESSQPIIYYDLSGRRVVNPTSGIYILRQGPRTTKILLK